MGYAPSLPFKRSVTALMATGEPASAPPSSTATNRVGGSHITAGKFGPQFGTARHDLPQAPAACYLGRLG